MYQSTIARLVICALALAPFLVGAAGCSCGTSTAAAVASSAGSGGCSSDQPIQPCSPQAVGQSTMGRIAAAQAGPQKTVIWQVKASHAVGVYSTTIAIGSTTRGR